MSIWDYMKPAAAKVQPTDLSLQGERTLAISWSDGAQTPLPARLLRQQCPCAACVDEWTSRRTLAPDSVPEDIALREVRTVGNYAAQLAFSDGHQSGIYAWDLLRELATQAVLDTH